METKKEGEKDSLKSSPEVVSKKEEKKVDEITKEQTLKKEIEPKSIEGVAKEPAIDIKVQTILNYIHLCDSKNIKKDQIMEVLKNAGWKSDQITKAFEIYEKNMVKELKKEDKDIQEKKDLGTSAKKEEKPLDSNDFFIEESTEHEVMDKGEGSKVIIEDLPKERKILDKYSYFYKKIPVEILIFSVKRTPNTIYEINIPGLSKTTEVILEEIRLKLIEKANIGDIDMTESGLGKVDITFQKVLSELIDKYFTKADRETKDFLMSYMIARVLGMGHIEIIREDQNLEEIAINSHRDPVWVYHRKFGWCKTNIFIESEDQIRQYASMIGRRVGRQITILQPLLDAHLKEGDRVNSTLMPISNDGNTITLRKFSKDPWTITKILKSNTMSYEAAALIWLAMQYELSALIVGGTASGKTSMLNVLAAFIPPNQRIISIEDTRELRLPSFLHWLPMSTRFANSEGKGEISMEDLLVNSLRMRPDRIIVGEIRRRREAETLFEAIHTGHSCYATFHANDATEAVTRLTNPPVDIPKTMLPAISLMVVQFRNRRSGLRRTLQLAEIDKNAKENVIFQYDFKKDQLLKINKSSTIIETLQMFTGATEQEFDNMIAEKIKVLKYLVNHNLDTIEKVGEVLSYYYTDYEYIMDLINKDKSI